MIKNSPYIFYFVDDQQYYNFRDKICSQLNAYKSLIQYMQLTHITTAICMADTSGYKIQSVLYEFCCVCM